MFEWSMLKAQDFTDPKLVVNLNCMISYDIKKDLKFEIVESKKGIFSSNKKHNFKAMTVEDLEQWVNLIKQVENCKTA